MPVPMILQLVGVTNGYTVSLPLVGISGTFQVDWGDSTIDSNTLNHTYSNGFTADYTIQIYITGTITGFGYLYISYVQFWDGSEFLVSIDQWGDLNGITYLNTIGGAVLTHVPTTLPSSVTNLTALFAFASNFNQDISAWDLSHVTKLSYMFFYATRFNQPIGGWDVSHVTTMAYMFNGATHFNQPIDGWDVSHVTTMAYMFSGASNFNQPMDGWDVSKVTLMNQMFQNAIQFNQPIGTWQVGKVTDTSYMFNGATNFNQDIGGWDVSKVTIMSQMFRNAINFNQDISQWQISQCTNLFYMFSGATNFNQDLGRWNVSAVTSMFFLTNGTNLDTLNCTMALIGWANLAPNLHSNVSFYLRGSVNSFYSTATNAYTRLTTTYGWIDQGHMQPIATPLLSIEYNQPTTRVYNLNHPIVPYIPALTGTYSTVNFYASPALSTIGLTLNSSTGEISGTPYAPSIPTAYTLTCRAYDSYGDLIAIHNSILTFSVYFIGIYYSPDDYSFLLDMSLNAPIQPIISPVLTIVSYSISPALPSGLTFDPSSGIIDGLFLEISDTTAYSILATSITNTIYTAGLTLTVAQINYAYLPYEFLVDVPIIPIEPTIFAYLYDASFSYTLPAGLIVDASSGVINGTPLITTGPYDYTLSVTTFSNYVTTFSFPIVVVDISYSDSPYIYVQNSAIFLQPTTYDYLSFSSIVLTTALPANLIFDINTGIISGTPISPTATQNYILIATTTSGYTKNILINITINGFSYVQNAYTIQFYESVKFILATNIAFGTNVYSNFTISPPLPNNLTLDTTTGLITGMITTITVAQLKNEVYFITGIAGLSDPVITIQLIIRIIDPNANACGQFCPPSVIIPRQIDTINTQAMRYSTLTRTGLGQTRFITNTNSANNRTYQEPPRNKF
jgi:surface protein